MKKIGLKALGVGLVIGILIMGLSFTTTNTLMAKNHSWNPPGWSNDELKELEGDVIVNSDSQFCKPLFLLDVDGDKNPDYLLNFGPWWSLPEEFEYPSDGDHVVVEGYISTAPRCGCGRRHLNLDIPVVHVVKLNDLALHP